MLRSIASISVLVPFGLASPSTFAGDALAAENGCTACHVKDHKVVGPAFEDIAAKYAGAADRLNAEVKKGGSGVWGASRCRRTLRFRTLMPKL